MLELKREPKEKSKDEPTVTEQSQDTTAQEKTMVSLKTEESKTTINKQSDFKRLLQEKFTLNEEISNAYSDVCV